MAGDISDIIKPLAVGGVGGSGTGIVAQLLRDAGITLGRKINSAGDCLSYSLLFGQPEVQRIGQKEFARRFDILESHIRGRKLPEFAHEVLSGLSEKNGEHHYSLRRAKWRKARAAEILASDHALLDEASVLAWGWKAPVTHTVLHRLAELRPDLKYVHVMRNGLDMAYGSNSRQLRKWGPSLFSLDPADISPANLLRYWVSANRRALDIGSRMGDRFYVLHFDRLVSWPRQEISRLLAFADMPVSDAKLDLMVAKVQSPPSIGRARGHDLSSLAKDDIAFVRECGFDTYGS